MKSIIYSLMGLLIFLAACNTLEDRPSDGAILSASQLTVSVVQNPAGSNSVKLVNTTKDIIMFWDWGSGTGHSASSKDTVAAYLPFKGTYTLRFTAFCAGGTVTDSTTFTIAQNDDAYFDTDPAWKGLTAGGAGQTWVWALDIPGGIIGGNGPENCPSPAWWTMDASSGNSWLNFNDAVYMDLNGAANFSHISGDGSVKKGFFTVIAPYVNGGVSYSAIQVLNGPSFPWPTGTGGYSGVRYHFTVMTADKLSVHDYGQYNIGMFKRKGFNY